MTLATTEINTLLPLSLTSLNTKRNDALSNGLSRPKRKALLDRLVDSSATSRRSIETGTR